MAKNLRSIMAELPEERRRAIEARAGELDRAITLRELRRALGISQQELAKALDVSQAAVSKRERRKDMQLGTLLGVVRAMGGTVEITARFPDGKAVRLGTGA